MWIDPSGVAHTVALPTPSDVMSPEFRTHLNVLIAAGPAALKLVIEKAEADFFGQDLVALADPEKESAFEGLTPPMPLLAGPIRDLGDLSAAIERTDWRWRLDVIVALDEYLD